MKINQSAKNIVFLLIIFSVGFGCRFFPLDKAAEVPPAATKTVIAKDILKARLAAKGVDTEEETGANDKQAILKPNPNTLHLRFSNSKTSFKLNEDEAASFGELVNRLKEIFRYREANGIFIEGTNEVYKRVTLPADDADIADYNAKGFFVEDFEKLVDDLRKEDITQIKLDLSEKKHLPFSVDDFRRQKPLDKSVPDQSPVPKVVSGGVVNGKATTLIKPTYPPAAKAVRAAGAVNVQVTIDEQGDVISASAVSGHPLLKAAAVQAARESKFAPTMLSGKPVKVTGVIVYNFTPEP